MQSEMLLKSRVLVGEGSQSQVGRINMNVFLP